MVNLVLGVSFFGLRLEFFFPHFSFSNSVATIMFSVIISLVKMQIEKIGEA